MTNPTLPDDDMPAEIDFSKGTRGKFFHPGARVQLPVFLEAQVQDTLTSLAQAKVWICRRWSIVRLKSYLPSLPFRSRNTASTVLVHCNRCHGKTHHALHGECKKTDQCIDEHSRTDIHFAETYSLIQCLICGQGRLHVIMWNSENDCSAPIIYPAIECRCPPEWLDSLEEPLHTLMEEVYAALDVGMYAIALMGVRSVLDTWVSKQTSDINNFTKKLKHLEDHGSLSKRQVQILEEVFDAGSAAAHRGYRPTLPDALSAIEALENLLHQHVLIPRVHALKENTPQRGQEKTKT